MANERRLIDANALLVEVVKAQALEPNTAVAKIIMLVTEAEKVDAVEVVHGRWIYEEEPDKDNNVQANCSVCFAGDLHATAMMNKVPYCWKCGAKMDGERRNDNENRS